MLWGDAPHPAGLIVLDRLQGLLPGVHHERSVVPVVGVTQLAEVAIEVAQGRQSDSPRMRR